MEWNYGTADGKLSVSLRDGNASSSGHLKVNGQESFLMGSAIGPGNRAVQAQAPDKGTLELKPNGGSGMPTSLSATGSIDGAPVDATLLPMMNRSIEDIVDAYRRSYAVFTISEVNGTAQCTRAIQGGPTLKPAGSTTGLMGPIGFDYENPGNLTFPDDVKNGICRPGQDATAIELHIPAIRSDAGTAGPVIIQFEGGVDHFADPPFAEPHEHISNVFYEEYKRSCLSVEYTNTGSAETIHFNHGRARAHGSVIIIPMEN